MDPNLYKATKESNLEVLRQHKDQLGVQLTANNNTVLHVAAQFHDSIECARLILDLQPSLIYQVNSKRETALHIAARNRRSNIVKELIELTKSFDQDPESRVQISKEMIRMTNEHKDTALHEAVRNNHLEVVEMIVREDAVFPHVVNNFGETPLYIAAKKGYYHSHDIVSTILDVCISPAHSGPDGKTALHAAVITSCPECTKKILEKKSNLTKEADSDGRTPLHYAAYLDNVQCAIALLKADKSIAYDKDKENQTALHIAAKEGHIEIIEEILSHAPDCWEIVNANGQNILHIAKEQEKEGVINFIHTWSGENSNLENQMDNNGNTSSNMRLSSNGGNTSSSLCLSWNFGLCGKSLKEKNLLPSGNTAGSTSIIEGNGLKEGEIMEERENQQLNPRPETEREEPKAEDRGIGKEDFNSKREFQLVVAALIATVTFTAGLTLPGGFHSNDGPDQGRALLVRNVAFKAFVITNALALALSVAAIFVHMFPLEFRRPVMIWVDLFSGVALTFYATLAMMIAFISGSYAVLSNSSYLAVGVLIIGSSFPLLLVYFLFSTVYFLFGIAWLIRVRESSAMALPLCAEGGPT